MSADQRYLTTSCLAWQARGLANSEISNNVPSEEQKGHKNYAADPLVLCNNCLVTWIFNSDLQVINELEPQLDPQGHLPRLPAQSAGGVKVAQQGGGWWFLV